MKKHLGLVCVAILSFAIGWILGSGHVSSVPEGNPTVRQESASRDSKKLKENPSPVENGKLKAQVIRVTDGDTILVMADGRQEKVRLIGADTPESVHRDKSRNVPEGKVASEWTRKLLSNRMVWLESDKEPRDRYGRMLAYVYLDDGRMVNRLLISEGMAKPMKIKPNVKYAKDFEAAKEEAKEKNAGFWGTGFFHD